MATNEELLCVISDLTDQAKEMRKAVELALLVMNTNGGKAQAARILQAALNGEKVTR